MSYIHARYVRTYSIWLYVLRCLCENQIHNAPQIDSDDHSGYDLYCMLVCFCVSTRIGKKRQNDSSSICGA